MPRIRNKVPATSHVCQESGCGQTFTNAASLRRHATAHSDERPFACEKADCHSNFKTKYGLQQHVTVTHSEDKPYFCPHEGCDRSYKSKASLLEHERVHYDEFPFVCVHPECTAKFKLESSLRHHAQVHAPDRHFPCSEAGCEVVCKSVASLKEHAKFVHNDDRKYVCPEVDCNLSFKKKSVLDRHMTKHKSEKPFRCPVESCSASFKRQDALKLHIETTHSDDRTHKCPVEGCEMTFKKKGHVIQHMQTHTEERPLLCPQEGCGYTFKRRQDQQTHARMFHTEHGIKERKKEEQRVEKALQAAGIDFKREHHVDFACWNGTSARLDFIIIKEGGVIVVETDESQHEGYGIVCDVARMCNVYSAWLVGGNTLPIKMIRYNPNKYTVDGKKPIKYKRDREAKLIEVINDTKFEDEESLSIQYMYYDVTKNKCDIWSDESFRPLLDCCCPPIY